MPQRQVDIAIVHQEVAVNDGSWRPLQHPLARVSGGRDIDKEGGTNTTLNRGGRENWRKNGAPPTRTTNYKYDTYDLASATRTIGKRGWGSSRK